MSQLVRVGRIQRELAGQPPHSRDLSILADLAETGTRLRTLWPYSFTDVSRSWREADEVFRFLRDRLNRTHHWRFGPRRQPMELAALRQLADGRVSWEGVHFLDIGCGIHHPLGISTLAIALGVASCFATDLEPLADEQRSAQATADLISFLLLDPVGALGEPCPPPDVICRRVHEFYDTRALVEGQLLGAVRKGITYCHGSFYGLDLRPNHFGLSHSHTVLEHIHDLPRFMKKIFDATVPGGHSFHLVDNQDHRIYWDSSKYRWWSFLEREEFDQNREDALQLCSRLRYSDHLRIYREVGFEIVKVLPRRNPIPREVLSRFEERFQSLSDDDLDIHLFTILLRKPASV
jgi:SAM-dependent methyltransferase